MNDRRRPVMVQAWWIRTGYLVAVGDQQFPDRHRRAYSMTTSGWLKCTVGNLTSKIGMHVLVGGSGTGFMTFIASTISSVSPCLTGLADGDERLVLGSGERKAVPTIGDSTASIGAGQLGSRERLEQQRLAQATMQARLHRPSPARLRRRDSRRSVYSDFGQIIGRQQIGQLCAAARRQPAWRYQCPPPEDHLEFLVPVFLARSRRPSLPQAGGCVQCEQITCAPNPWTTPRRNRRDQVCRRKASRP